MANWCMWKMELNLSNWHCIITEVTIFACRIVDITKLFCEITSNICSCSSKLPRIRRNGCTRSVSRRPSNGIISRIRRSNFARRTCGIDGTGASNCSVESMVSEVAPTASRSKYWYEWRGCRVDHDYIAAAVHTHSARQHHRAVKRHLERQLFDEAESSRAFCGNGRGRFRGCRSRDGRFRGGRP